MEQSACAFTSDRTVEDKNFNLLGRSRGVPSPPVWHKLGTEREPNCVENLRRNRFQSEEDALPTVPTSPSGPKCPNPEPGAYFLLNARDCLVVDLALLFGSGDQAERRPDPAD